MTQLTDVRKTKKINLPSYPDVEVEVYDGLLTYQVAELQKAETDLDRGIATLQLLIKSWSFVDAEEKPLAITIENLKKLPTKDFSALMTTVEDAISDEEGKKKKS